MKEIWKTIEGYDYYFCSNFGNIKTIDHYIYEHTGKPQFRKGTKIVLRQNKNGYLQFALNKNGKRKMVYVHKIIAETFLGKNPDMIVNHIDGNKLNNCVDNLEYTTYSENNSHSYKKLDRTIVNKGAIKTKVKIINTTNNEIQSFSSVQEASRNIDLSPSQIRRYLNSEKTWKNIFKFVTE